MLGTATVSGRLARTDRVYIGLDGPAGLAAGRALRSAPQALPALREQPEHARRTRRRQNDPAIRAHGMAVLQTSVGGTQWHALSAADTCLLVPQAMESSGRVKSPCADNACSVVVDGEVVVGRRRSHRAGVRE